MSPRIARQRGFTLIELMIVVVVIGILAAIAIPKFGSVSTGAKESEAAPILKQLFTLQERYRVVNAAYATDMAELEGGLSIRDGATYYDFGLTGSADGATYLACATPKAAYNGSLRGFQITQARQIVEGTC